MLLYEFFRQFPELDENDNYSYCYVVASKSGRFIRRGKWYDDNIMDARASFKYRRLYSFNVNFLEDEITITIGGAEG